MPMRTWSASVGSCVVQLLDRLQDAKAGADCALGVVLVCRRCAEDRHDRVPDELLDRAAVALDLLPQARVVGADASADVLGVSRFGCGGEADEVAEEDGDHLALLLHRGCRLCGQRGRTERAEREVSRELLAARRAGRHARSVWRLAIGHRSANSRDIPNTGARDPLLPAIRPHVATSAGGMDGPRVRVRARESVRARERKWWALQQNTTRNQAPSPEHLARGRG